MEGENREWTDGLMEPFASEIQLNPVSYVRGGCGDIQVGNNFCDGSPYEVAP